MAAKSNKDLWFVGIQILLLCIYLLPVPIYLPVNNTINSAGLITAAIGLVVVFIAVIQLNKNLTPFPTPKEGGELITTGLYKFIRHPIYTGIILTVYGYSLYMESVWKFFISTNLLVLFHYKSKYEEGLLLRQYEAYKNYIKITGRFFPFL
jgi:protein-S-isoprenylcysteine O-methyltransferase Ste14